MTLSYLLTQRRFHCQSPYLCCSFQQADKNYREYATVFFFSSKMSMAIYVLALFGGLENFIFSAFLRLVHCFSD